MKDIRFQIMNYRILLQISYSELDEPDLEYTLYNIDFILYEIKGKKVLESFAEVFGDSAVIYAIDDTLSPVYRLLEIRITAINGGLKIIANVYTVKTVIDLFNGNWRRKEPTETKVMEVRLS